MRAMIMAGGTGGHVFPALAVADILRANGWQVEWLGGAGRMEEKLVPKAGIKLNYLQVRGLRGNGLKGKLAAPLMLVRAVWQAWRVLRRFRPDVVVGFGGFASGPGGLAAVLNRSPLLIHEQNAVAGMTNRYLARFAKQVFQAFPGALNDAEVVGNPVRRSILSLPVPSERYGSRAGALRLLITGGSQGASALNEQLPPLLTEELFAGPIEVRHQCGKGRVAATQKHYNGTVVKANVTEFIDDMDAAYSWADLVICRAGALTVSEVAAAGVAALFIPFPAAVDDHQTRNARWLVDAGAARLLAQKELNAAAFLQALEGANQREALLKMANKARELAVTNSAELVAQACEELAHD